MRLLLVLVALSVVAAVAVVARGDAGQNVFHAHPARYSLAQHSNHYRHQMGHNLQTTRAGLKRILYSAGFDDMCEGCGGNHPQLYWVCDKCQENTDAACWAPEGRLVPCKCKCGYMNRCLWIRWP